MTHKEIAGRLREIADARTYTMHTRQAVRNLADTLDPPRPKFDEMVWCRWVDGNPYKEWWLGLVGNDGVYSFGDDRPAEWDDIEWKPARILGPGQVAVNVPPVREWDAERITVRRTITRAEAELMEAGDD